MTQSSAHGLSRAGVLHHLGLAWVMAGRGPQRLARALAWIALASLAVMTMRWAYLEFGHSHQQDFRVYLQAARDLLAGESTYQQRDALPYTYPPVAAAPFVPLALLPEGVAVALWVSLNAALAVLLVSRLLRGQPAAVMLLAVLGTPFIRSTTLGQINLILFTLLLADLLWTHRGVGWLVGIAAALKITPATMGAVFLMRRDWPGAARSIAAGVGLTGLGWLAWPDDSQRFWTELLWDPTRVGDLDYPDNQSLMGSVARLGLPHPELWHRGASLAVIGLVALVLWRGRAAPRSWEVVSAIGLATLLIAPVSWSHHWIWLTVLAAVLLRQGRTWAGLALLAVLMLEPRLVEGAVPMHHFPLAAIGVLIYLAVTPRIGQH